MARINYDRLKLELQRARRPFLIFLGLVVIGGIGAGVMLKNLIVQWPWQDKYKVRVAFVDVKGVQPGRQQVRIAGVPVGLINKSQLVDGKPVLTLSLLKKYAPLYKDAVVRLRPQTPLQDMYVAVESRGHPSAGKLTEHDILPATQSITPVDISRVLDTFDPDTRSRLGYLLHGLGQGLQDRGVSLDHAFVQLAPFLHEAQRVSTVMNQRHVELARVIHNLGGLSQALGERDRQLHTLVSQGNTSLGELAANRGPFGATLAQLPPTLVTLQHSFDTLRANEGRIDAALYALRPVATALKPGLGALKSFSSDALPAFDALEPAVKALGPLSKDLAPTSASIRSALTNLQPTAPRLDSITKQTVPCEYQVQKFFSYTMSVLKFGDNHGAVPRGVFMADMSATDHGTPSLTLTPHPGCRQGATAPANGG